MAGDGASISNLRVSVIASDQYVVVGIVVGRLLLWMDDKIFFASLW